MDDAEASRERREHLAEAAAAEHRRAKSSTTSRAQVVAIDHRADVAGVILEGDVETVRQQGHLLQHARPLVAGSDGAVLPGLEGESLGQEQRDEKAALDDDSQWTKARPKC